MHRLLLLLITALQFELGWSSSDVSVCGGENGVTLYQPQVDGNGYCTYGGSRGGVYGSIICSDDACCSRQKAGTCHFRHTYTQAVGRCVHGHNLGTKYTDKSVEECAVLCTTFGPECLGFEYGATPQGSQPDYWNPRDCRLSSGADTSNCDGSEFQMDFYTRESIPAGYTLTVGGCVFGNNIEKHTDKTAQECADLCTNHGSDCLGFEYGRPTQGSNPGWNPRDCQLQRSADIGTCNGAKWKMDFYTRVLDTGSAAAAQSMKAFASTFPKSPAAASTTATGLPLLTNAFALLGFLVILNGAVRYYFQKPTYSDTTVIV